MMYSEITKELFRKLVTPDMKAFKYEDLVHADKLYWLVDGVVLVAITNFITPVTQYYIQDINT